MNLKNSVFLSVFGALALFSLPAQAQQAPSLAVQANPTPGCSVTPAQLAANKKAALQFFVVSGADRVALADPSYKQHNPQFVKRAAQNHESDYDEFKSAFMGQAGGRGPGGAPQAGGRGAAPGAPPAGVTPPPQGNQFEVVTAECDIVTIIHKRFVQDPTEAPGTYYEAFTFDSFRVKDGKLTEHWDGATITAPPAAPATSGR